jgi:hypothetical protein
MANESPLNHYPPGEIYLNGPQPAGHSIAPSLALPFGAIPRVSVETRFVALLYQSKQSIPTGDATFSHDKKGVGVDAER